jgi:hypothetical protein
MRSTGSGLSFQVEELIAGGTLFLSQMLGSSSTFSQPVSLIFDYHPDNLPHLDLQNLVIRRYDPISTTWQDLPTSINSLTNQASTSTTEPGDFDLQAPLRCFEDNSEPDDIYNAAHPLSIANPISAIFDIQTDQDWYFFYADQGVRYVIQTSHLNGGVNAVMELYSTDGKTMIEQVGSQGGQDNPHTIWTASTTGKYFIRLLPGQASAIGCTASYQVSLGLSPDRFFPLIITR